MKSRITTGLAMALVLALALFTGTALAGGGNGHGGGNGPGQSSKQSSTSPAQPATGGDNSTGVKPSNQTKHNTYAQASSNQTKQYGNGKTAGQIATQAGYGNATLHGPGNSQPHKTMCGGHEVDVHALKNKGSKCGSSETQSSSSAKSTNSQSAASHEHVTICHATGSASHPFVMISPSASGVFHGHMGHQDGRDIIPPFTYNGQTYSQNWTASGQAIFKAGCEVASTSGTSAQATSQTQSSTSTKVTSSSTAAAQSAGTSAAPAPQSSSSAVAAAQAAQAAQAAATPAPTRVATPAKSAGAVKGATVTLTKPKAKQAGGVLGTTTRLGRTVGATKLPFTGLSLTIFALVAAGLIGGGLAVRRASANRI